ncbi:hypothetical protein EYS21_09000 [Arthrobacter sp. S39]|nr:hypothetical protein EYS21_09000 [Arthrobacter sp. S39]
MGAASRLHAGQRAANPCEPGRLLNDIAFNGVKTHVSDCSLSVGTRRRSEAALAFGRDCVLVSTSTLELGIDVWDLDRVIQLVSPRTIASLLQRLA